MSQISPELFSKSDVTQKKDINPIIYELFNDLDIINALPDNVKNNPDVFNSYLSNTSNFANLISSRDQKYLGEEIEIPETIHADGRIRRDESGQKINLDYIESQGIDPKKVLFFRVSGDSNEPKPEYYWTSDYYETAKGLHQEITAEARSKSTILVSDLKTINENGGLIKDINDDNGLAVRQIGTNNFDQSKCIAKIKPTLN
jgi:hypothetical protein